MEEYRPNLAEPYVRPILYGPKQHDHSLLSSKSDTIF